MPTPTDTELVRYLSGDATPAEARAIQRWLEASPDHRVCLENLRLVLEATEPPRIAWDAQASWDRLGARLEPVRRPEVVRDHPTSAAVEGGHAPRSDELGQRRLRASDEYAPGLAATWPRGRWRQRVLVAAGLAAAAIGGWYVQTHVLRFPSTPAAVAFTERRTGRGERVSFHLADGTSVMLGPASRLRYAADYGQCSPKATTDGCARTVELEGDGYFEVIHDEARPFLVRTATATVRDLGTRFAVRARPEDRRLEVAVAEGSVAIGRAGPGPAAGARDPLPPDSVVLAPGDVARLADTGGASVRRGVNLERYLGWTDGRLEFERAPLPEVVEELARWYDVEIHLADARLRTRQVTAAFRDKPITDVLELIAASLDLRVSHDRSAQPQRFVLDGR